MITWGTVQAMLFSPRKPRRNATQHCLPLLRLLLSFHVSSFRLCLYLLTR